MRAVSFALLCSLPLLAKEPQVVKLSPPMISKETLLEKIVCTRPMREGKFNISLEQTSDKMIIHCYGHGGSGWTTLFGSVQKAIDLFEKTNPNKDTPIKVIGSGCVGLTTAIELARLGYHVNSISTKSLYDTPSWKAGGCFALASKVSLEEQESLDELGLYTFKIYQTIESGEHPYISPEAVKLMPLYCCEDTAGGVQALESRGLIPTREYVSLEFDTGVVYPNYIKYMTYFMNTTSIMQQLINEVKRLGINIEIKEVMSFNEVEEKTIFDCSGMGGKELNSDVDMIPVRGHLITLNGDSGTGHMEYMLTSKVQQNGKEAYIYMFPKSFSVSSESLGGKECRGVLGGTFIPDSGQMISDEVEFRNLLDRNCEFFYGRPFHH